MFRDRSGVTVVRTNEDGSVVYRKNNKLYTIARASNEGFYPGGSRAAAYKGHKDHRHSPAVIEMVRERRRDGKMGRHVKPGPQSW